MRRWMTAAAAVLVLLLAAACGGGSGSSSSTGAAASGGSAGGASVKTLQAGQLLVGSDIPYPPFEYGNPPGYQGFDVELMDDIAKRMGLKVTWRPAPFNPIFNNLRNGTFDAVISAATITPEREKIVAFSDPYYDSNQSILVKADNTTIHSEKDLEGKSIGVQQGTTGEAKAKAIPGASVRSYPAAQGAFNALLTGQVDAVVNDLPVSALFAKQNNGVKLAGTIKTGEQYGIAVSKDNPGLLAAINKELAALRADGTYKKIYEKYFGQAPPS
jgi:polar amino acid transport system substrate-binding protein